MDLSTFIKAHNQFILLITGLDGCHKNNISNELSKLLNIKIISYKSFIINNQKPENYMIYDNIIDWNKFNETINKEKDKGIIVVSPVFITENIKFICDCHIHFYMNKQKIKNIIQENDNNTDIKIVNQKIIPYYFDVIKKMYINKSIDISNIEYDEQLKQTIEFINDIINDRKPLNKQIKSYNPNMVTVNKNDFIQKIDDFIGFSDNYNYKLSIDDLIAKTKFYEYSYDDINGTNKGIITFKYNEK